MNEFQSDMEDLNIEKDILERKDYKKPAFDETKTAM